MHVYTIILFADTNTDISKFDMWIQDYHNNGYGHLFKITELKEEVADIVLHAAYGRKSWNLLIVKKQPSLNDIQLLLDTLERKISEESGSLVYMPQKALIYDCYGAVAGKAAADIFRSGLWELPSYCRRFVYEVDTNRENGWQVDFKFFCIMLLLGMNWIPSEFIMVYHTHIIDIELDTDIFFYYLKCYYSRLIKGLKKIDYEIAELSAKEVGAVEVDLEAEKVTGTSKDKYELVYETTWSDNKLNRNKEYYRLQCSLKEEIASVQKEVRQRNSRLRLKEEELSEKDRKRVLDRQKQEELDMLSIILDISSEGEKLDKQIRKEEQQIYAGELLKSSLQERIGKSFLAFLYVILIYAYGILNLKLTGSDNSFFQNNLLQQVLNYKSILCIAAIALLYSVFIVITLRWLDCKMYLKGKEGWKKAMRRFREFVSSSSKKYSCFASSCCMIAKLHSILLGDRAALAEKSFKAKRLKKHSDFCKKRIDNVKEWIGLCDKDSYKEPENCILNSFQETGINSDRLPEEEVFYRLFDTNSVGKIAVNDKDKKIDNPFPFVNRVQIKRDKNEFR